MIARSNSPRPGLRAVYLPPEGWRPRAPKVAGSQVALLLDDAVPGADMYSVINTLAPGATIPLHWHSIGELQFILSGHGVFIDVAGCQVLLAPHGSVFSPPGPSGAHGFTNTGPAPLTILCVYPSPGGHPPDISFLTP